MVVRIIEFSFKSCSRAVLKICVKGLLYDLVDSKVSFFFSLRVGGKNCVKYLRGTLVEKMTSLSEGQRGWQEVEDVLIRSKRLLSVLICLCCES